MFIGLMITFHAILATFILELIAIVFYFVAAFFYHIADALGPHNPFTGCFYAFFMLMYFAFATVDSTLLFASVIATESCILVGWILGCLFGGIWVANKRHQLVRRVCHRIRWTFRHKSLKPPRTFCRQRQQMGTDLADQNAMGNDTGENHGTHLQQRNGFPTEDDYPAPPPAQARAYVEEEPNRAEAKVKKDMEQQGAVPF